MAVILYDAFVKFRFNLELFYTHITPIGLFAQNLKMQNQNQKFSPKGQKKSATRTISFRTFKIRNWMPRKMSTQQSKCRSTNIKKLRCTTAFTQHLYAVII